MQEAVGLAADAATCFLEDGPTVAMNRFNAPATLGYTGFRRGRPEAGRVQNPCSR